MYVVLFGVVFVETGVLVGFFLPGDSILFAAGLLSAEPGSSLSLPLLVAGVTVAAITGDAVGYWTGRRLGRPWLVGWSQRHGNRAQRHLERAERFYDRWGSAAVVVARFIPWVRTFTPVLAGVARMPYRRFLAANVVGALVWGAGLVLLGHIAYSVGWVRNLAYAIAGVAVLASVVVPVIGRIRASRSSGRAEASPSR